MQQSGVTQALITKATPEVVSIFSSPLSNGLSPLVLIPERRGSFFGFLSVPSGAYCIAQSGGRNLGVANQGLHFHMNPYWRIAFVVCQQTIQYDSPVTRCATKDDVMVDLDLTLVFRVVNPDTFVYQLGASKFDILLRGSVEEAIRHLAR